MPAQENLLSDPQSEKLRQLTQQQYEQQLDEFNKELRQVSQNVNELQKQLDVDPQKSDLKKPSPSMWNFGSENSEPSETSVLQIAPKDNPAGENRQEPSETKTQDVFTKMMQEYQALNESYEQIFGRKIEDDDSEKQTPQYETERRLTYKSSPRITAKSSEASEAAQKNVQGELLEAEARAVLSEHKTFASFAQDRFNNSMRAAESYMQEGKFYLAADAYAVACMYKPEDPLAYAGQSHALFAAGEYISSSLYLAKAIEMFPGYVDFQVDIVAMIGDADTVEKRINDINQLRQSGGAAELNFLLAYINMQLGRLQKANEAITAANERMPDLAAVKLLQQAIEKRLGK